ncbi:MAG: CBS domain-containing protein [Candidatus Odinarchaeia archaeon]
MLVRDIMYPPISVDKDSLVPEAIELMEKNKTTHILVTDENKLVGLCSDFNLVDRLGSSRLKSISTKSVRVSSVMSLCNYFINEDMSVVKAAKLMWKENRKAYPIGNEEDVKGFITLQSFLKTVNTVNNVTVNKIYTSEGTSIRTDERVINVRNKLLENSTTTAIVLEGSTLVGLVDLRILTRAFASFREVVPGKYHDARIKNLIVQDIMLRDPDYVTLDSTLAEAAKLLGNKLIYGAPVIKNEKLYGVLYLEDILSWIATKQK